MVLWAPYFPPYCTTLDRNAANHDPSKVLMHTVYSGQCSDHANLSSQATSGTQFLLTGKKVCLSATKRLWPNTTLLDIVFERVDDGVDDDPPMNLTELWVFGVPGSDDGARFSLANRSPRYWEVTDIVTLWVTSHICTTQSPSDRNM